MLSFFKKILLLKQLLGAGMSREEKNNKKLDCEGEQKTQKTQKTQLLLELISGFKFI